MYKYLQIIASDFRDEATSLKYHVDCLNEQLKLDEWDDTKITNLMKDIAGDYIFLREKKSHYEKTKESFAKIFS